VTWMETPVPIRNRRGFHGSIFSPRERPRIPSIHRDTRLSVGRPRTSWLASSETIRRLASRPMCVPVRGRSPVFLPPSPRSPMHAYLAGSTSEYHAFGATHSDNRSPLTWPGMQWSPRTKRPRGWLSSCQRPSVLTKKHKRKYWDRNICVFTYRMSGLYGNGATCCSGRGCCISAELHLIA